MTTDLARKVARAGREPSRVFQFTDSPYRKNRYPLVELLDGTGRRWVGPTGAPWLVSVPDDDPVYTRAEVKWGTLPFGHVPAVDEVLARPAEPVMLGNLSLTSDGIPVYDVDDGTGRYALVATVDAYLRRSYPDGVWLLAGDPYPLLRYEVGGEAVGLASVLRLRPREE